MPVSKMSRKYRSSITCPFGGGRWGKTCLLGIVDIVLFTNYVLVREEITPGKCILRVTPPNGECSQNFWFRMLTVIQLFHLFPYFCNLSFLKKVVPKLNTFTQPLAPWACSVQNPLVLGYKTDFLCIPSMVKFLFLVAQPTSQCKTNQNMGAHHRKNYKT